VRLIPAGRTCKNISVDYFLTYLIPQSPRQPIRKWDIFWDTVYHTSKRFASNKTTICCISHDWLPALPTSQNKYTYKYIHNNIISAENIQKNKCSPINWKTDSSNIYPSTTDAIPHTAKLAGEKNHRRWLATHKTNV